MSLFENDRYRWRETFFVMFDENRRPQAKEVRQAIEALDPRYEIQDMQAHESGLFEAVTIISADDYSAMDITFVDREEVADQGQELARELKSATMTPQEEAQLARLPECNVRLDLFHFEQLVSIAEDDDEEDELLDPGSLLIVIQRLAELCRGVGVDPAGGALM